MQRLVAADLRVQDDPVVHPIAFPVQLHVLDERGTTRTCPDPACRFMHKPSGRVKTCPKCGLAGHRDAIGAWNINAKGYESIRGHAPEFREEYVAVSGQKYLTPVGTKGVRRSPAPRNPYKVVSSAEQPRSAGASQPNHATSRDGKELNDAEAVGRPASMEQAGTAGGSESQKIDDKSVA